MINDKFKEFFTNDIIHIDNYVVAAPSLHKGVFPAVADGMLKSLKELKELMEGMLQGTAPDFVQMFLLIGKVNKFTKNVVLLLTEDIKALIRDVREFIDDHTFDFEDQFYDLFVNKLKKIMDCKVKQEAFPIFMIDDRFKVEFNFKKSLTVLDGSITVQSIDPEKIAEEAADNFRRIWIDNEDIKFSDKAVNEYFEIYKKIVMLENKSYGDYIGIFELHKYIFIERQNELFWRECRPELIKKVTINHTRAALSNFIESGIKTVDGYEIKLGTVRDNVKDGVAVYSANDRTYKYYGLIAFSREE